MENGFVEGDGVCRKHPFRRGHVGVCSICLCDRLGKITATIDRYPPRHRSVGMYKLTEEGEEEEDDDEEDDGSKDGRNSTFLCSDLGGEEEDDDEFLLGRLLFRDAAATAAAAARPSRMRPVPARHSDATALFPPALPPNLSANVLLDSSTKKPPRRGLSLWSLLSHPSQLSWRKTKAGPPLSNIPTSSRADTDTHAHTRTDTDTHARTRTDTDTHMRMRMDADMSTDTHADMYAYVHRSVGGGSTRKVSDLPPLQSLQEGCERSNGKTWISLLRRSLRSSTSSKSVSGEGSPRTGRFRDPDSDASEESSRPRPSLDASASIPHHPHHHHHHNHHNHHHHHHGSISDSLRIRLVKEQSNSVGGSISFSEPSTRRRRRRNSSHRGNTIEEEDEKEAAEEDDSNNNNVSMEEESKNSCSAQQFRHLRSHSHGSQARMASFPFMLWNSPRHHQNNLDNREKKKTAEKTAEKMIEKKTIPSNLSRCKSTAPSTRSRDCSSSSNSSPFAFRFSPFRGSARFSPSLERFDGGS